MFIRYWISSKIIGPFQTDAENLLRELELWRDSREALALASGLFLAPFVPGLTRSGPLVSKQRTAESSPVSVQIGHPTRPPSFPEG